MEIRELHPVNGQKSFYGKAVVLSFADGTEILRSYDTKVLKRKPDGTLLRMWYGWSATTGRHIKAFCGLNKAEYEALPYCTCTGAEGRTVSVADVRVYADRYGKAAAASWLLLVPPDIFDGDYEAMLAEMCD